MAHYALQNYGDILGDNPSLVVAFANLLNKMGHDIDPVILSKVLTQDDTEIDWWSLPEYFEAVKYEEITESGPVWPAVSNAIVRLVREAENGEAFEHYCLVADPLAHSIIDSMDGKVKRATAYGELSGWASYSKVEDVEFEPGGTANPVERAGQQYTVLTDENIWDVARKTKAGATEILQHNGIADGALVKAGMVLYIPNKEPLVVEKKIEFESFAEPHAMHVTAEAGTKKWNFGNAKKWDQLSQSGPTQKQYTNLQIYGVARVPIGDEVAAYYMDSQSFGDYATSGSVTLTSGFSWKDLAEGHCELPKPEPLPEGQVEILVQENYTVFDVLRLAGYPESHADDPGIQIAAFQTKEGQTAPELVAGIKVRVIKYVEPEVDEIAAAAAADPDAYPNFWKSTYKAFEQPENYLYNEDVMVHDLDGSRPSKTRFRLQDTAIAGIFIKDSVAYGRPVGAASAGLWFGIPMDKLVTEQEIYKVPTTIPEKQEWGLRLSKEEKIVVFFSKWLSKYTAVLNKINKKFSKKEQS